MQVKSVCEIVNYSPLFTAADPLAAFVYVVSSIVIEDTPGGVVTEQGSEKN